MSRELDKIDRRILYELMVDTWNNSPPAIAEKLDIAPGTVRNRIEKLENTGVIEGYHAHIDFERTDGRLTTLFLCNVPFADREIIARAAYEIPGVTNVRVMMGGRRSFHVLAVGEDTEDLRRIGTTLSELGVEIEDEMLMENEAIQPYTPFVDDGPSERGVPTESLHLTRNTESIEITVDSDSPIAGTTISDAVSTGLLAEDPLITSIERGSEMLTPHGDTTLQPGDVVNIFSSGGIEEETIASFTESGTNTE